MEIRPTPADQGEVELARATARRLFDNRPVGDSSLELLAELGMLGLLVPPSAGGIGWHPTEASVVVEEAGQAGDTSPIIGALVGVALLARAVTSEASARWLDGALLGAEPVLWVSGSVRSTPRSGGGVLLDGSVGPVIGMDQAAALIVSSPGLNPGFFAVATDQPGVVAVKTELRLDERRQATSIALAGVPAEPLDLSSLDPEISGLVEAASILACCDSLGTFRSARSRLTEYLRDRVAFGAAIASFQAVQHRLVDLYALERRMEAAIGMAVQELAGLTPTTARAVAVAVAYVGSNCRPALDECVQLSGGLGFVWDYPLHHEMRRVVLNAAMFAPPREARTRLAHLDGW
jgi:alkylation response protein AidB-like acyl-CoA dehydrogenase